MDEFIPAFTPDQAARYSGMSQKRLTQWIRKGLLTPSYTDEGWLKVKYMLSFRDLVALRTLLVLVETYDVPLKQLHQVNAFFQAHYKDGWATLTIYVLNHEVIFDEPTLRLRMSAARPGQQVLDIPLQRIVDEERERMRKRETRSPEEIGTIVSDKGRLYIGGTRIPASVVWEYFDEGLGAAEILRSFPLLKPEDIDAALAKRPAPRTRRSA